MLYLDFYVFVFKEILKKEKGKAWRVPSKENNYLTPVFNTADGGQLSKGCVFLKTTILVPHIKNKIHLNPKNQSP